MPKRHALALVTATLGAASLLEPSVAAACSCAELPPVDGALEQAAAVFEGVVESFAPTEGGVDVTLTVTRAWKGVTSERVRVRSRRDETMCGYGFEQGRGYLVYAFPLEGQPGATLGVSLCSRTRPIEEAGEDVSALGEGVVPVDPLVDDGAGADPEPPPTVAPGSGGCASCAVTGRRATGAPLLGLVLAGLIGGRLGRSGRRVRS